MCDRFCCPHRAVLAQRLFANTARPGSGAAVPRDALVERAASIKRRTEPSWVRADRGGGQAKTLPVRRISMQACPKKCCLEQSTRFAVRPSCRGPRRPHIQLATRSWCAGGHRKHSIGPPCRQHCSARKGRYENLPSTDDQRRSGCVKQLPHGQPLRTLLKNGKSPRSRTSFRRCLAEQGEAAQKPVNSADEIAAFTARPKANYLIKMNTSARPRHWKRCRNAPRLQKTAASRKPTHRVPKRCPLRPLL